MTQRRSITITLAAISLVVTAVLAAAPGMAEARRRPAADAPWRQGVTREQMREANRLMKEATKHWVQKEVREALRAYQQALKHWDHPSIWRNIAQCLINLDRPLEAYQALKKALRYGQGPHSAEHYQQALDYQKLLRGRLARLTVRCQEPGARVTVNGKQFLKGPGERTELTLPGEKQIVAMKEGYVTVTRKVLAMPGKDVALTLQLVRVKELVKKLVRRVVWKRRWKRWIPWTVLGAGLVVAAVGVPLMVKSQMDFNKFDDYIDANCEAGCLESEIRAHDPTLLDLESSGKKLGAAAIAMFAVGGAVITAGITLLIMNRPTAEEEVVPRGPPGSERGKPRDLTLLPTLLPGGAGVLAGFSF